MRRAAVWAVWGALLAVLVVLAGGRASYQCVTQTEPATWRWRPVKSPGVSGGFGQAVVGTDTAVFLVKCLYATTAPEFYRYDPAKDLWSSASTTGLPTGTFRSGTALAWDRDKTVYALAGARYGDPNRREFWRYRINLDTWERLPDTPYAQGAGNAITWSEYDESVYAIVGSHTHNRGRSYFVRYDHLMGTWTVLPFDWENTDDGASLAWAGEYIYALQGEVDDRDPAKNRRFARFHIPSQKWKELPEVPDSGGVGDGGSLLWVGSFCPDLSDYIFALGGGAADENSGNGFYLYTISTNTWRTLDNLPCSVGFYVGNRLAFAGGHIFYWQGERKEADCKGRGFYRFDW